MNNTVLYTQNESNKDEDEEAFTCEMKYHDESAKVKLSTGKINFLAFYLEKIVYGIIHIGNRLIYNLVSKFVEVVMVPEDETEEVIVYEETESDVKTGGSSVIELDFGEVQQPAHRQHYRCVYTVEVGAETFVFKKEVSIKPQYKPPSKPQICLPFLYSLPWSYEPS